MKNKTPIFFAILAAACYGVSAPFTKLLLVHVPPVLMAALMYLGAGLGMGAVSLIRGEKGGEAKVARRELPYIIGMVALDIAAPILIMLGLTLTTPATVSLINNFEIAATAVIALALFREAVGRRMWVAIALITAASAILSIEDFGSFRLSLGAVFVLLACICWGFENNCTRMLSLKNPLQIVMIKGFGSGLGALVIAFAVSEWRAAAVYVALGLLLGFVSYGMSVYFYILAQRQLGAARTSAYYALAPFIGAGLSLAVFGGTLSAPFWIALAVMTAGAYCAASETHAHEHTHTELLHEHRHSHDEHHGHTHEGGFMGEHSHAHTHAHITHSHRHTPDLHHAHRH